MPVVAAGIVAYHKDWKGFAQLTFVTALTYGTAYGLKHLVRECRPYARPCAPGASEWDSFPSTTSAIASAPSSFVWRRYGWGWGLPMFIVSKYPSYALDKSKQNRIWDGLASTGIAWGLNYIFTPHFREKDSEEEDSEKKDRRGFYTNFDGDGGGVFASVGYRW